MEKEQKRSKKATLVLICILLGIIATIILLWKIQHNKEVSQLQIEKTVLELNDKENKYIAINKDQIVKVTLDGVVAYDKNGQEIWSDTISLDSIVVKQRDTYLGVGSKSGKKIEIFDTTGKKGEIVTENPISYFSVNANGEVALIEEIPEGHKVSAYNSKGEFLRGRITYSKEAGFPTCVEVSPNSKMLLITYVNTNEPTLSSNVQVLPVEKQEQEERDMIKYGVTINDSLIYEIEFLNDNTWMAIGDKKLVWYTLEGDVIQEKEGIYATYVPYLNSMNNLGPYIGILGGTSISTNLMHNKETLYMFNAKGELTTEETFTDPVTYFYMDNKGVVVGDGKKYKGYNKMGNLTFEYASTQDINKLVPIDKHNQFFAVTKGKVLLLTATK